MMKLYKYTYYIKRLITFCFLTTFLLNGFLASAQNLKDLEIANDYFFRKEYNKAKLVYEKLLKKNSKQQDIHSYYLKCLMELGEFKKAKRYLGKQVRNFPEQTLYKIDYGKILGKLNGEEAQKAYYAEYIESEKNKRRLFAVGQFLKDMKMYLLTEKALLRSMSFSIDTYFELADLYGLWGKDELMIKTLFGILNIAPVKLQQVQNFISNHITTNQQKQLFQKQIVRKIQKSPRA